MKTTVKDFILDNMTDSNFEKLVNTLILDSIWQYQYNDELFDKVSEYLNKQETNYTKNTFEILNEIKKLSDRYITNYKNQLLVSALEDLNDTRPVWMPTTNHSRENLDKVELEIPEASPFVNDELEIELDISDEDIPPFDRDLWKKDDSEYTSFDQLKIAFLSETCLDIQKNYIEPWNVDTTNYQKFIHQEKSRMALGLSNFIYEVLHYTTENKLKNNFEQFSNERSPVKIDNDNEYNDDYYVYFLLDHRSQYVSAEQKMKYSNHYSYQNVFKVGDIENDDGYVTVEFSVSPPKFVEYGELWEDLTSEYTYILAPFTAYLTEELIVPEVSKAVLHDILEQLIQFLTFQGFTKLEQIEKINDLNEQYKHVWNL